MWTKICGFTNQETAIAAVDSGANAVGLNFYQPSTRYVEPSVAKHICDAVGGNAMRIGLFVNEPIGSIRETVQSVGLDAIQLHGDEDAAEVVRVIRELPTKGVIKAFNVDERGLGHVVSFLSDCAKLGVVPWAILLDASVAGERGGTGHVAPWATIQHQYDESWPDLILAGGLNVNNVAEAINTVQPWGIDVASGVESSRGVKDASLIEEFLSVSRKL